jgi:hypothetical protein
MKARQPVTKVNRRDLGAALKTGDHLAGLEALRDQIANDIDACGSSAFRDRATLYYRLIGVLLEIETLRPTVPAPEAVGRMKARRGGRHRWPVSAGPPADIPLLD